MLSQRNETLGFASEIDVLFWKQHNFPISASNRSTHWMNDWNRHWEMSLVDTWTISNQIKFPSNEC